MMLAKTKWIFVLLLLSLLFGCASGEEEATSTSEPVASSTETPASATEAPAQAVLLTNAEQERLKAQYAAEAEAEITGDNAEQVAEDLEREIDAELASEQL
jgi:hypothetical protein